MEMILIILMLFGIILWICSFFLHDPYKMLQEDIDQLFMQQLEEIYLIKKKLKVLEEELLVNDMNESPSFYQSEKFAVHDIIKNQVLALAQQGIPLQQIAEQSSLPAYEVQAILGEFTNKE